MLGSLCNTGVALRKAATEYSVKQRVGIWFSRNEQNRLKAHCADGCPWWLYRSVDNRSNGMVIKTYQCTHNYLRKWVVKRCTSRWLAEKYLESFKADHKMTLANFVRIVQKEWNLTPSRSKLQRARRLAMQTIIGDEVEQYELLWDYENELRKSNPGTLPNLVPPWYHIWNKRLVNYQHILSIQLLHFLTEIIYVAVNPEQDTSEPTSP
jgi:hypothetical protein